MCINNSPPTTLDFDQEVGILSSLSKSIFFNQRANLLPGMSKRSRPVTSHGLRAPSNPSTLPPYLVGLTETPVSSSSPGLSSTLQPSLSYVPVHPNSTGAFLAPEGYLSDQRASPVSDAMDSIYTWSSASEAEMLRTSASVDPVYFDFDSQQSIGQPIPPMGLTPQDINQWCINSHSTGFQTTSYPAISSSYLPAEPAEMCQQDYTLNENMTTSAHAQWLIPTDNYLSPVPAVSVSTFDTNSVMSTSPTPTTISDLDILVPNLHNSPTSPTDLTRYGIPTGDGAWRCAYPGCTSQALFRRGCDLRKHFNRHRKHLFCRHEGCPQSRHGGFSSKKDRARHEAKHNPGIVCEWEGCGRVFSRVDNMRDHLRRIHRRGASR